MVKKPIISAASAEGQLDQIQRYLSDLAADINKSLEEINKSIEKVKGKG